mmetsp:Transcript_107787/g.303707  ORF Transcript_107787/g.303707 Transcript_107787/m.303707 type:complete len:205 (+) Transcript_107787:736-1350(+)
MGRGVGQLQAVPAHAHQKHLAICEQLRGRKHEGAGVLPRSCEHEFAVRAKLRSDVLDVSGVPRHCLQGDDAIGASIVGQELQHRCRYAPCLPYLSQPFHLLWPAPQQRHVGGVAFEGELRGELVVSQARGAEKQMLLDRCYASLDLDGLLHLKHRRRGMDHDSAQPICQPMDIDLDGSHARDTACAEDRPPLARLRFARTAAEP